MLIEERAQQVVATPTRGTDFNCVAKLLLGFRCAAERIQGVSETQVGIWILGVDLKHTSEGRNGGRKISCSEVQVANCQLYLRQPARETLRRFYRCFRLLGPLRVSGGAVFVPIGLRKCGLRLRVAVILLDRTLKDRDRRFDILQLFVTLQVTDALYIEIVRRKNGGSVIRQL